MRFSRVHGLFVGASLAGARISTQYAVDVAPINQDDFTVEGITAIVDDVVYLAVKGHTVTVDIQKPDMTNYIRLTPGYAKDYIAFIVPGARRGDSGTVRRRPVRGTEFIA